MAPASRARHIRIHLQVVLVSLHALATLDHLGMMEGYAPCANRASTRKYKAQKHADPVERVSILSRKVQQQNPSATYARLANTQVQLVHPQNPTALHVRHIPARLQAAKV